MHDVIVIGAGPAGNMAALHLARAGKSVAVLDMREAIGDKLCTGIIGNECARLFPPKPEHIHSAARSVTIVSPSGVRRRIRRAKPHAYIVDRVAYVRSVADGARQQGAEYTLGARVSDIRVGADAVQITANRPNGVAPLRFQSRMAIVAAGFGTPLLRRAGVGAPPAEYLLGQQTEIEAPLLDETEVHLGSGVAPGSFAWIAPQSNGRALIGVAPRKRKSGLLQAFIGNMQQQGRVGAAIGKPRSWGIPIRPAPRPCADRVIAAGDAAGLVKPTTGGGIYYSFISGRIAAETAERAIDRNRCAARDLRRYRRECKAAIGNDLRVAYYARMLYESLNDAQIDRLMDEFLSDRMLTQLIGEDFDFDWHGKAVMKALRHADMRRVLGALGPAAAPFASRLLQLRG